jgi:hypothetical protein
MNASLRKLAMLLASALLIGALAGCGSLNEKASAAMGEYIPMWAGGLPPDAPPRPGTAKYDEWMKERERLRQMPAQERERAQQAQQSQQTRTEPSGLDPVH